MLIARLQFCTEVLDIMMLLFRVRIYFPEKVVFTEEEAHYQNLVKQNMNLIVEIYFSTVKSIIIFSILTLFQEQCQHHKIQETIMRSPLASVVAP